MAFIRRLLDRLWPDRRLFVASGVRRIGRDSLVVEVDDRSYWVHAKLVAERPPAYLVWASEIRDITSAPTIVAAPPAASAAVPEVRKRLEAYFAGAGADVTYR